MSVTVANLPPGTVVAVLENRLVITFDTPEQAEAVLAAIMRCDRAGTTLEWHFGVPARVH